MTRRQARLYPIPPTLTALVDPRLTGAACTGRAPYFDAELPDEQPEHRSARLAWATRECTRCPVQSACRVAVTELDQPTGLWAGHLTDPAGTPGRPRKAATA
ncbi:WhiB family transcriptional regulator [Rhodococcus sp. AH-ZY2]|uniref:WhiB family transcriptional regulator n=1 Tax=Rhodococcus sp. AH-ZY2 TaxID=3047468 RepID=UPI0027DF2155|nr:WhiB family transcriptional regulator [Rhodococcus sp. AH-ZY2]WML64758.1 WhiB family transcriptional regulator [Rhodococcus sp. AH-ZY2]